ncbi:MAG TPA: helix-turn-helix domain-containing protein [Thermoplasmata archaeon]|nr:helix-turn-helix domain-containing protein [Thermoplasmata archaeon]
MDRDCCEAAYECPCPPTGLIDVVGKKWAVCIVTLLGRNGGLRFGPIQRALPRVSPATLTATLRALERERLVLRTSSAGGRGSPVRYDLTERGLDLHRNLLPLARWCRTA